MDSYEERYKQALEWMRNLYPSLEGAIKEDAEHFFPELKEREDERIRKALMDIVHDIDSDSLWDDYKVHKNEALDWLEKQGEQTGKVQPKYNVGNWIVNNHDGSVGQIERVVENLTTHAFGYDIIGGGYFNDNTEGVHLWTIEDAKDGDVLYVSIEEKSIHAIFKKYQNGIIYFHCNFCGIFEKDGYMPIGDVTKINPLQPTQVEKFFQKMKEAGYEWDAEKKELKKIDTNKEEFIKWCEDKLFTTETWQELFDALWELYNKRLDSKKVIEWLDENVTMFWESPCNPDKIVKIFKKDFGLCQQITEDYCSFELSKLLREKGFDGQTHGNMSEIPCVCFITHQMAMKWLREVHKIWFFVYRDFNNQKWDYGIYHDDYSEELNSGDEHYYKTHEEAVEAALKYCLTKLI